MRGTTASQRRLTPATAAPPPPAIAPGEKAAPLADDAPLNFSAAALIATHSCLSCSTREARILLIYARSFSIPSRKFADKAQPVIPSLLLCHPERSEGSALLVQARPSSSGQALSDSRPPKLQRRRKRRICFRDSRDSRSRSLVAALLGMTWWGCSPEGDRYLALEAKSSPRFDNDTLRGLRAIRPLPGLGRLLVYTGGFASHRGRNRRLARGEILRRRLPQRAFLIRKESGPVRTPCNATPSPAGGG